MASTNEDIKPFTENGNQLNAQTFTIGLTITPNEIIQDNRNGNATGENGISISNEKGKVINDTIEKIDNNATFKIESKKCSIKCVLLLIWDLTIAGLWIIPLYCLALVRLIIPKRNKDLSNDVVLVLNGGSGLGREAVMELVKRDARVAVCDENLAAAQDTVDQARLMKSLWCIAFPYQIDVSDLDSIRKVQDEIARDFETNVTMLVLHDPEIICKSFLQATEEDYADVVCSNFMSHIWIIKTFLPAMKVKNKGHIVSISSIAGYRGISNAVGRSATDFAIRGMTEALRNELEDEGYHGIKVTCVHPYFSSSLAILNGSINLRLPPIDVVKAARILVDGISRGYEIFTVPSYMYYLLTISASFPRKLAKVYDDLFYMKFYPNAIFNPNASFKRKRSLSMHRIKNRQASWQRHD